MNFLQLILNDFFSSFYPRPPSRSVPILSFSSVPLSANCLDYVTLMTYGECDGSQHPGPEGSKVTEAESNRPLQGDQGAERHRRRVPAGRRETGRSVQATWIRPANWSCWPVWNISRCGKTALSSRLRRARRNTGTGWREGGKLCKVYP